MFTKTIAITLVIALMSGLWIQNTAYAGDKEWATAGKVLAGVVGLAAVQQIAAIRNGPPPVKFWRV